MQKKNRGLATVLLFAIIFTAGGCSPQKEVYTAGLARGGQTEPAALMEKRNDDAQENGVPEIQTEFRPEFQTEYQTKLPTELQTELQTEGWVHVCGAVQKPGVYPVKAGMRVCEAVELAGGFAQDADCEWLNLAQTVQDGQQICVFTKEETREAARARTEDALKNPSGMRRDSPDRTETSEQSSAQADGNMVNLNTAGCEELQTLPGIGKAKASAIIQYREEHGSFQSIEEIQKIPGIKNAIFSKIKERITV